MTNLSANETLVSSFPPFISDDGIEINRLEDIPRELTLRQGVRKTGTNSPVHSHEWGQLLYASNGVMQVMAQGSIWVIPSQRAVWIPPCTLHSIKVIHSVTLRNIYVAPKSIENMPTNCQVMHISPLLRELIAEAVHFPALYDINGPQGRIARVILDCLKSARSSPLHLPVPEDGPVKQIAERLKTHPADPATLEEWAERLGTTSRTLARHFKKQTGMTFGQWRQQVRLLEALSRLAMKEPIANIALDLGYSSQSAFSAMFRKTLGTTPGKYFNESKHD